MPKQLVEGLRRFRRESFPWFREHYQRLVAEGQRPSTLFLGCADSRIVPDLLTSALPGDLFVIRNVGNLVPPFESDAGFHGTSAGIEFATLVLEVKDIVVCGHSHCGAIRALFTPLRADAPNITRWLELARPAVVDLEMTEANLRRTEMRSVVLQVERLMSFPTVRERVERGELGLHAWYYVIEEGQVLGLNTDSGEFRPLSKARSAPYPATPNAGSADGARPPRSNGSKGVPSFSNSPWIRGAPHSGKCGASHSALCEAGDYVNLKRCEPQSDEPAPLRFT